MYNERQYAAHASRDKQILPDEDIEKITSSENKADIKKYRTKQITKCRIDGCCHKMFKIADPDGCLYAKYCDMAVIKQGESVKDKKPFFFKFNEPQSNRTPSGNIMTNFRDHMLKSHGLKEDAINNMYPFFATRYNKKKKGNTSDDEDSNADSDDSTS